jgi:hypothetical protein
LARIRRENDSLKDQLQRTLKELKYYQVKYPNEIITPKSEVNDDLPPWVTSSEVMTPLLRKYDTRKNVQSIFMYVTCSATGIAELEALLEQREGELDGFHEKVLFFQLYLYSIRNKVEEILAENEALRDSQFENLRQNTDGSGGANASTYIEHNCVHV